jgi:hypothetical protein
MTDFKNNPEIVRNEYYPATGTDIKASLVICVWNTSHLLKRSIETYCTQDFPTLNWELIVIDDNSMDDVFEAIKFGIGKINIRYIRLEHNYGMRGNTMSFNTGFAWAKGEILMESTPEIMFTPDAVRIMYEPHLKEERAFVATKTYNLEYGTQMLIDTVDWRRDINAIKTLEGFNCAWTLRNEPIVHFGTHQSCSIKKSVWYEITNGRGYPLYFDYGSDDPYYAGLRSKKKVKDITIMQPMLVHQFHLPFNFWAAKGYAPMLNKWNHTTSNVANDDSGEIPTNGTCAIWDGSRTDKMDEEEMKGWFNYDEHFLATGGSPKCLKK